VNGPILVIQTAFAGDLVLTTPLIAETAERFPGAAIDVLCIPATASLLAGHPAIRRVIVYDKHRRHPSLISLMRRLARERYALCLCPHRSLRSALLARATRAPRRIAFHRSAGRWLFTETVPYREDLHEADRNRSLLSFTGIPGPKLRIPALYPSEDDHAAAARLLETCVSSEAGERTRASSDPLFLCIAPGSVWATKRWTEEGFAAVARYFAARYRVMFLGGAEDHALCARIITRAGVGLPVHNVAGQLGFLASAALIGRAAVLVSNDSAPVHLASAMGTPVVEVYGATSPAFGFSPYGVPHRIVQHEGLSCRPCAIHGGDHCPVGTFACMRELPATTVIAAVEELLETRE
jgi:heptosyltransferase-2